MLQKNDEPDPALGIDNTGVEKGSNVMKSLGKGILQIILMVAVLAVAFLATMRLVNTKPEVAKRPIFPTVYTVDAITAKSDTHQPNITVYGEVVAGRSVELRSLVSGEVVAVSDKLKSGGKVQKGDTLIEIDSFSYEGDLREAKANSAEMDGKISEANARVKLEESRLQSTKDQLALAKSDISRIAKLRKRGTATEKQLEERKLILSQREQAVEQSQINIVAEQAKISQLNASVDRLKWRVEQSERNLKNTKLIAPFTGTIRTSSAEVGKLANANDIVVSMYQTGSLEARFVLTDERFGRLQADADGIIGRELEILWHVGGIDYRYPGRIDRIGAEIASNRGGVEVFATILEADHSVEMRPGAFVEISLPDRTYDNFIKLPDSSIYHSDTVFVIENGELVERKISIAAYYGDAVLVQSGLADGEEVLTTRISEISSGLKVRKEGDPIKRPVDGGGKQPEGTKDKTTETKAKQEG